MPRQSIEAKITATEQRVAEWSTAILRAVNRLRYYQKRLNALQKRARVQRPRPATATRAIRLRDTASDISPSQAKP